MSVSYTHLNILTCQSPCLKIVCSNIAQTITAFNIAVNQNHWYACLACHIQRFLKLFGIFDPRSDNPVGVRINCTFYISYLFLRIGLCKPDALDIHSIFFCRI